MSRREDIQNSEWTDSEELLPFHADGKLLAIWARTNRHLGLSGFCRVAPAAIRFETGLSPKRFEQALDELQRAGYLRYDEPLLFVPSRAGRLSGVNPNMARSIYLDLKNTVGVHPFRREFVERYHAEKWFHTQPDLSSLYERESETVAKPLADGYPTGRDTDRGRDAA